MERDEFVSTFRRACYQLADTLDEKTSSNGRRMPYNEYMGVATGIMESSFPYLREKLNGEPGVRSRLECVAHWVLRDSGMDVRSIKEEGNINNDKPIEVSTIDLKNFDRSLLESNITRQEKHVGNLLAYI